MTGVINEVNDPVDIAVVTMLLILGAVLGIPALLVLLVYITLRSCSHPYTIVQARMEDAYGRLAVLEQQVSLFWRLVERSLATKLHAPTHRTLDHLLEKLRDGTITHEECLELTVLIRDRESELIVEGTSPMNLEFPRLMTLWALEVRIARYTGNIQQPEETQRNRGALESP